MLCHSGAAPFLPITTKCNANKAIRVIAKAKFRDSVIPLYYELKILKISELGEFEIAKLMH